ncbi:MAG: hypothetical protein CM1200mP39_26130 [Dehalococcoidia bacterium]|nr:MAG: hypothetical protein CM1200mP39_26130 [Dehalococcoidia bacterium]
MDTLNTFRMQNVLHVDIYFRRNCVTTRLFLRQQIHHQKTGCMTWQTDISELLDSLHHPGHRPKGLERISFNMDIVGGSVGSLCEVLRDSAVTMERGPHGKYDV